MNIAFRVDASFIIGSGHLMRCLTLADALKKRGAATCFICRHMPENLQMLIASKAHRLVMIDKQSGDSLDELCHAAWLATSQLSDAQETLAVLSEGNWDWLVVDHYGLDFRWENLMRRVVSRIMVIDDIADRNHDCDILLDQNFHIDMSVRYSARIPVSSKTLLGPSFALLREEFYLFRRQVQPRVKVSQVLVFFGGVDVFNCTGKAVEALACLGRNITADIVIGTQHPCREQIEQACMRHGFRCHVQTERMAALMLGADISIGAGGSASWERCCLGLPSVCVTIAANQIDIAKSLHAYGAVFLLGEDANISVSSLMEAVSEIVGDNERLHAMSAKAMSLVDGMGAIRVADTIYEHAL